MSHEYSANDSSNASSSQEPSSLREERSRFVGEIGVEAAAPLPSPGWLGAVCARKSSLLPWYVTLTSPVLKGFGGDGVQPVGATCGELVELFEGEAAVAV